jgi:hypothetical protein
MDLADNMGPAAADDFFSTKRKNLFFSCTITLEKL